MKKKMRGFKGKKVSDRLVIPMEEKCPAGISIMAGIWDRLDGLLERAFQNLAERHRGSVVPQGCPLKYFHAWIDASRNGFSPLETHSGFFDIHRTPWEYAANCIWLPVIGHVSERLDLERLLTAKQLPYR